MLKNKRIFIILFIAILILSLPTIVNAAVTTATETTTTSTGSVVNWSYELSSEVITNLKCTNVAAVTGALTIPETIDGYKVTSIGNNAFEKCYSISEIIIPNGVNSVGNNAFANCNGLKKITIPNSVTSLGQSVFLNCTGLTSITMPNSVTSLGRGAFRGCVSLSSVILPQNLSLIVKETFYGCTSLTEIVLPDNLTTISGEYSWDTAFEGCSALKWVKIPSNVTYIDENTFDDCKNVTIYCEEGSYAQTFAESKNINFEKIENWESRKEAKIAPKITKITAKGGSLNNASSGYEYQAKAGDEISVAIQFDKDIVLKESPKLIIKFGTGDNKELTTGIVSSNTITYRYVVKSEDVGAIQLISLTGGDVTDNNGVQINNKLTELSGYQLIAINAEDETIPVEIVSLDKNALSLEKGEIYILATTVKPTTATNKAVKYTSSDEKIAKVDSEGKITAIAKGIATITVTTEDGGKTATCKVTVTEPEQKPEPESEKKPEPEKQEKVLVETVELDKTALSLEKDKTYVLTVTVKPTKATNKTVKYTSSDEKIVTVNAEGKITAITKGTATITVTTEDGAKTATCRVTVTEPETNKENNKENNSGQKEETQENKENNKANKIDNTVSKVELPKTGKLAGIIGIITILITLIVFGHIKNKQYKEM